MSPTSGLAASATYRNIVFVIAVVLFIAIIVLTVTVAHARGEVVSNRTLMCQSILNNTNNTARNDPTIIAICQGIGVTP